MASVDPNSPTGRKRSETNDYCCDDPLTGKPLTVGEFFDLHAMTFCLAEELEGKLKKE
jgi:hypothetical protein